MTRQAVVASDLRSSEARSVTLKWIWSQFDRAEQLDVMEPYKESMVVSCSQVDLIAAQERCEIVAQRKLACPLEGFVEVGPGKVLSGILKRMGATRFGNVEDVKSLDEVLSWMS